MADWYASVCVNTHTIPASGGVRVDQIQLCAYHNTDPGNHFRGTKDSNFTVGLWVTALNDDPAGGDCSLTTWTSGVVNPNACWVVDGTLDISYFTNHHYTVQARLSDGAAC